MSQESNPHPKISEDLLNEVCNNSEQTLFNLEELSASESDELAKRLVERGVDARTIDGSGITTKEELLDCLAQTFGFPEYFGRNWDALTDCLSDLSPITTQGYVLILLNSERLHHAISDDFVTLQEVFQDAAERYHQDVATNLSLKLVLA